ncbi:enoyl-CoA hydratase/isomerase family protein [Marinomonas sp. NPDC078689]|uniref:enoyl-CoA hydratase/isomerase family protein n=1 Tax=Marinomonas sp. NPDC078689 TaxID=3364147 RepID=UPI0037C54BA8
MTNPVVFEVQPFAERYKLGVIRLNHPSALNALSMEMIEQMLSQLESWRMDQTVVAIWLEGAGDKAFCAGGNVVDVYRSLVTSEDTHFAHRYFEEEYALDYLLHRFPKPIICWGSGYVMGGGMGLMMASRYRVVTPSSKLAMPEISIGLYPDVGASYFLNQLESKEIARFMALTGYQVSATDACELGLATHYIMAEDRDALIASFANASMVELDPKKVTSIIEQALFTRAQSDELPLLKPELTALQPTVMTLMSGDIENVYAAMLSYSPECPAMIKAKENFLNGSPLSAHLILAQLDWAHGKSLESVFMRELQLSVACCAQGDFKEGVRALLVDKDKQPKWQYGRISDVPKERVMDFFKVEEPSFPPH